MPTSRKRPQMMSTCMWCGVHKPIDQMRHPASSRGKTPSTCHSCRESHPDESWCDYHNCAHPRSAFTVTPRRPLGVLNICHDAAAYQAAEKRAKPTRTCLSCGREQESWFFRGGRAKRTACRDCEAAHLGSRWCIDCAEWLTQDDFPAAGSDGKFHQPRCRSCRVAYAHGVTRAYLTKLTGSAEPICAVCGSIEDIKIDHDHRHCDCKRGCKECVRGYLCHGCNAAEGLLKTAERAQSLADYMKRLNL